MHIAGMVAEKVGQGEERRRIFNEDKLLDTRGFNWLPIAETPGIWWIWMPRDTGGDEPDGTT